MAEREIYNENNIIKNLGYNMTKSRIRNTKYLITLGRNVRVDSEPKVKDIIKLYSESKNTPTSNSREHYNRFNL